MIWAEVETASAELALAHVFADAASPLTAVLPMIASYLARAPRLAPGVHALGSWPRHRCRGGYGLVSIVGVLRSWPELRLGLLEVDDIAASRRNRTSKFLPFFAQARPRGDRASRRSLTFQTGEQ